MILRGNPHIQIAVAGSLSNPPPGSQKGVNGAHKKKRDICSLKYTHTRHYGRKRVKKPAARSEIYSENGIENVPLSLRSGYCKFDLCRQDFFYFFGGEKGKNGAGVAHFADRDTPFE